MRLKMLLFVIVFETIVITIFISSKLLKQEFSFIVNDPLPHSVRIYNSNLWAEISLSDDGQLNTVSVADGIGRAVHVSYSDIGIVSYVITDTKTDYKIANLFPNNFSDDMVIGKNNDMEKTSINDNEYFSRYERYKSNEKSYKINYKVSPFFFDIQN